MKLLVQGEREREKKKAYNTEFWHYFEEQGALKNKREWTNLWAVDVMAFLGPASVAAGGRREGSGEKSLAQSPLLVCVHLGGKGRPPVTLSAGLPVVLCRDTAALRALWGQGEAPTSDEAYKEIHHTTVTHGCKEEHRHHASIEVERVTIRRLETHHGQRT